MGESILSTLSELIFSENEENSIKLPTMFEFKENLINKLRYLDQYSSERSRNDVNKFDASCRFGVNQCDEINLNRHCVYPT